MDIIKGSSLEEQMKYVDRFLGHVKRRLHKKQTYGVSPIPVSGYSSIIQSDGSFFQYMSPFVGKVKKVIVEITGQVGKRVTATVTIFKVGGSQVRQTIAVKAGRVMADVAWDVSAGDKVKARIDNWGDIEQITEQKDKTIISEIWIALAIYPDSTECLFETKEIEDEGIPD